MSSDSVIGKVDALELKVDYVAEKVDLKVEVVSEMRVCWRREEC